MKKLTCLLAVILSFVVWLGGVSPALAQDAVSPSTDLKKAPPIVLPQPPSLGITTLYTTAGQQAEGVKVYRDILKYDVAIPNPDFSAALPKSVVDFPAFYQKVLADGRKKNGTNGSFTVGWFDFQAAVPATTGNQLFTVDAPDKGRIYSVVAGLPETQCPLKIRSTQIAFFDNVKDATAKANALAGQKFLVYVSPVDKLTIDAFSQLFYNQKTGKRKTDPDCFLVSGATEKITTDFTKIFTLLPPALQQPAHLAPFEFSPKVGDFIYLVNARKSL